MNSFVMTLLFSCFREKENHQADDGSGFLNHQIIHRLRDAKVDQCEDVTHIVAYCARCFLLLFYVSQTKQHVT